MSITFQAPFLHLATQHILLDIYPVTQSFPASSNISCTSLTGNLNWKFHLSFATAAYSRSGALCPSSSLSPTQTTVYKVLSCGPLLGGWKSFTGAAFLNREAELMAYCLISFHSLTTDFLWLSTFHCSTASFSIFNRYFRAKSSSVPANRFLRHLYMTTLHRSLYCSSSLCCPNSWCKTSPAPQFSIPSTGKSCNTFPSPLISPSYILKPEGGQCPVHYHSLELVLSFS